ncbi:hypothetical protein ABXT60_13225 [Candidatus Njordibacter sp. Uisw_056]|uniref:peptidoglycan-binding domain-containing protein n=1 Tax=Candidatus Njordibacter sp. Uisw_056 TaxID=3230973 RepID=UPI003D564D34
MTFLFSISLLSHGAGAIVLPEHDSVTYNRIVISTNEARKASDVWIVVNVKLYGTKVLGKKFLNNSVEFSYDSHFMGNRADLGLKIANSSSRVAASISKAVSRGKYKQHKRDWGVSMYVGAAKYGRQQDMTQFLYGAKANSEQDYIMLAWMLANSNDIIKYAVENDSRMSSRAKIGWRKVGDFTRAAYGGSVSNLNKILAAADDKTPSASTAKIVAKKLTPQLSFKTRDLINGLESKNKQLTFQVKSLNERSTYLKKQSEKFIADTASSTKKLTYANKSLTFRIEKLNEWIVSLKEENEKLSAKAQLVSQGPSSAFSTKYRLFIQRVKGQQQTPLGYITLALENGKLVTASRGKSFMKNYLPTQVVGTYADDGDFKLLITADFMREGASFQRTDMTIKGNLFTPKSITIKDQYSVFNFSAQTLIEKEALGCYRYRAKAFIKPSKTNQRCDAGTIYISSAEMAAKKLSLASSQMVIKIIDNAKKISSQQQQLIMLNTKLGKAINNPPQSKMVSQTQERNKELVLEVGVLKQQMAMNAKTAEATLNQPQSKTVKKTKQRNNQLTLEVVSLKERIADLNSKLLTSELAAFEDADKIALGFCVSTKLKHIYAIASNNSCVTPYVEMDQASVIGFSQASGIEDVTTWPWVSVKSLTNAQIKTIQYLLVREGFSTSQPDGLLGPKTIKAIQSLLSKIGSEQSNKVVSSQLYLQKDLLDLLLTNAQLAEIKDLQRQTAESNNVINIKDDQINQLSIKINGLVKTASTRRQVDEAAYKLKVSKLNDQVNSLNQQIAEKNTTQRQSLLSKNAVASQLTSDLVTAETTITAKDAEIKRLTNELAVVKVKSKNNQINDSSFMETLSDEWRPLIVDMPLTERLFCDLYHDFRLKKDKAEKSNNQIRVNMVHRSFQEDLDSLLPRGSLDQWIVKVLQVSQVAGGDAAIIAELPCDVLVGSGTMNTEEGSDDQLSWVATIPYSSRLYNELAKVSIGDFVNVSGTFVQIEAFKSGRNETFYASNSIGKNPLVAELGLDKDLYLLDLAYFMMLR